MASDCESMQEYYRAINQAAAQQQTCEVTLKLSWTGPDQSVGVLAECWVGRLNGDSAADSRNPARAELVEVRVDGRPVGPRSRSGRLIA